MKYSPRFSKAILPVVNGSPPHSPLSRRNNLGIMQAATLSACSAAFAAAMATALCILTLTSQSNLFDSRTQILASLQANLDRPRDGALSTDCGNIHRHDAQEDRRVAQSFKKPSHGLESEPSMESRYSGRRSITPIERQWPQGAVWLMSFPNSGTSYTIHTIRELTNTTTATNYGLEGEIKDKESVPAFEGWDSEKGPFLELIPRRRTNIPRLILTKTHCGGFSTTLHAEGYIETPRSFLKSCLKSKRGIFSTESNSMETQSVWYSPDLVKKAIHIIRNPMDNIVARFHLERKRYTAKNNKKWLADHPNDKVGFRVCTTITFLFSHHNYLLMALPFLNFVS